MITYVDYVEYDGPAYRAGMREGDVILSINGTDMEKADHKTLVNYIKGCENRMRMVVLFEDCVRKVELHMRYIQLQNILRSKMNELERICLREREVLDGKWKTHSLPARKKASSATSPASDAIENGIGASASGLNTSTEIPTTVYQRPALSTEDVTARQQQGVTPIIPPPAQFMLTYQYLDPMYRYVVRPSTSASSGEFIVPAETAQPQRSPNEIERRASQPETSADKDKENKTKHKSRHCHGHSCNPCIGHFKKSPPLNGSNGNGDNVSLDAYDLASPCCNAQCVPTKKRSKHHKEHHHKHKHRDKEVKAEKLRSKSQTNPIQQQPPHHHHHHYTTAQHEHFRQQAQRQRNYDLSVGLASHCSLHSCGSNSEYAPQDSTASYTTSLSTDTLYWDPQSEGNPHPTRQPSTKSRQSSYHPTTQQPPTIQHYTFTPIYQPIMSGHRYHAVHPNQLPVYHQTPTQYVTKPKSWDNLTAANRANYNYGYLDTVPRMPNCKPPPPQYQIGKNMYGRYSSYGDQGVENYAPPPSQFLEEHITTTTTITTKSTENLLENESASAASTLARRCECMKEMKTPQFQLQHDPHAVHSHRQCRVGYYSNLPRPLTNASTNMREDGVAATISEITRL